MHVVVVMRTSFLEFNDANIFNAFNPTKTRFTVWTMIFRLCPRVNTIEAEFVIAPGYCRQFIQRRWTIEADWTGETATCTIVIVLFGRGGHFLILHFIGRLGGFIFAFSRSYMGMNLIMPMVTLLTFPPSLGNSNIRIERGLAAAPPEWKWLLGLISDRALSGMIGRRHRGG